MVTLYKPSIWGGGVGGIVGQFERHQRDSTRLSGIGPIRCQRAKGAISHRLNLFLIDFYFYFLLLVYGKWLFLWLSMVGWDYLVVIGYFISMLICWLKLLAFHLNVQKILEKKKYLIFCNFLYIETLLLFFK